MEIKRLLGEYEVRLDAKGRFRMPSGLLNQLGDYQRERFVVTRGFEKCLVIYPEAKWDLVESRIAALNEFQRINREFARYFYRGAQELTLDSADRMLLSRRLLDYAGIEQDVVLHAHNGRIDVWSTTEYDRMLDQEPPDFSRMAEQVLGEPVVPKADA